MKYVEITAKEYDSVRQVFLDFAKQILEYQKTKIALETAERKTKLGEENEVKEGCGC